MAIKTCPQCMAEAPLEDRFCEECGAHLLHSNPGGPARAAAASCLKCGAGVQHIDEDGFCSACGFRREPPARDHFEHVVSPEFAGVSDRGVRHHRNEDFFAIDTAIGTAGAAMAMVVCDGVSSTNEADQASEAAAAAAFGALSESATLTDAVAKAQSAVAAIGGEPATTLVAAVVRERQVSIASVGDSRAYWIAKEGSRQLTSDDSWMNDVVSSGAMSADEARKSSQAHAITRWLGADATAEDCAPSLVEFEVPGPGYLMLCTDGLWNYAPEAETLAAMVYEQDATAIEKARRLVDFANAQGGQDNITVVLLSL